MVVSHGIRAFSSAHRVQHFPAQALSGWVGGIGQEGLIDRSQHEFETVLHQQHLARAPANGAAFRP